MEHGLQSEGLQNNGLLTLKSADQLDQEAAAVIKQQQAQLLKDVLASTLQGRFDSYKDARHDIEREWLDALKAYQASYTDEQLAVMKEQETRSRVYIGITRMKVQGAYSRLVDMLLQNVSGFWSLKPNTPPDLPQELRSQIHAQATAELMQFDGIPPEQLQQILDERIEEIRQQMLDEQASGADRSVKALKAQIEDYLHQADALTQLRTSVLECCITGTGCIKSGTLKIDKQDRWQPGEKGQGWQATQQPLIRPDVEYVSVFDLYPDPYSTETHKPLDLFRRHVMTRSQLRELLDMPGFDQEKVRQLLSDSPDGNHVELDHERERRNMNSVQEQLAGHRRYDVLEYWGEIDGMELARLGVPVDDQNQEYQANIWFSNGYVLMSRLNPLKPQSIPYKFYPYENTLHRFWGTGLPAMMADSQAVMNSAARALLDNAAISSGPMAEIDVSMLPAGTSQKDAMRMYPWRVWLRDGGDPMAPMIRWHNPQANQSQLVSLIEMFRKFSDEETSMPSYTHGETGQGLNKTATGMSMLMNAANVSLKSVTKNFDDHLIRPVIRSLRDFAMRWADLGLTTGDLDILAQGSTVLIAKEIQSQRMTQVMQMTANPIDGPLIQRRYLLTELLKSLDVDPEKAMISEEEHARQQQFFAQQQQANAGPGNAPGRAAPAPAAAQ